MHHAPKKCGSYTSEEAWFSLQWPNSWAQVHITVKKLFPIVLSVAVWGWQWAGVQVKVRCDNVAVVHILRTGWRKNEMAMHLLRSLFFWLARTQVTLEAVHIPGSYNGPADSLSGNDPLSFLSQVSYTQESSSVISQAVKELLIGHHPDWMSLIWTALWGDNLQKD